MQRPPYSRYEPKQPVVEVDWIDSYGSHGWASRKDRLASDSTTAYCKTVGYLIRKSKNWIELAESVGMNDNVGCSTTIPRAMVARVRTLSRGKKK